VLPVTLAATTPGRRERPHGTPPLRPLLEIVGRVASAGAIGARRDEIRTHGTPHASEVETPPVLKLTSVDPATIQPR